MYKSDLSYQKVFPEPTERYRNVFNLPLLFSIDLPIFGFFFQNVMNLMCALKKAFHKIPRYRNIDTIKFYSL